MNEGTANKLINLLKRFTPELAERLKEYQLLLFLISVEAVQEVFNGEAYRSGC